MKKFEYNRCDKTKNNNFKTYYLSLLVLFFFLFFSFNVFSLSVENFNFENSNIINNKIFIPKSGVLKVTFDNNVNVDDVYLTLNSKTLNFYNCEDNVCSVNLNFYSGGKYELKVYDNTGFLDKTIFVVDVSPVVVNNVNFFSEDNSVFLNVNFKDYADYDNKILGCGLKSLKILDSDKNVLFENNYNNVQNSLKVNVDSFKEKLNSNLIFVFEDCFGNKKVYNYNNILDLESPKILSVNGQNDNLKVSYKNNGFEKLLYFDVKVEENNNVDLEKSSVNFKSSSINIVKKFSSCNVFYENKKKFFSCSVVIPLTYVEKDFSLKVFVSDGNSISSKTFNGEILVDDVNPKFLSFKSNSYGYNNEMFLKDVFYVDFEENFFIDKNSVVVKLNNFNSLELSPDFCYKKKDNIVRCVFNISNILDDIKNSVDSLEATLISAKDENDNEVIFSFTDDRSAIFYFDDKKPSVKTVLFKINSEYYSDLVLSENSNFILRVIVFKEGSVLSNVYYLKYSSESDYEKVPLKKISCYEQEKYYVCDYEGFELNKNTVLNFLIEDSSGNSVVVKKNVLFSDNNVNLISDAWFLSDIIVSPKYFIQSYDSDFSVNIPLLRSEINPNGKLSSSIVECSSENADFTFVNSYVDDVNDEVVVSGSLISNSDSKIKVDCELKIKTYDETDNSFSNFESHNFSFYLFPFGYEDNNIFNSDGSFKRDLLTSSTAISILSSADKLLSTSEDLCNVLTAIKTGSVTSDAIAITVKYGIVTSAAYPSVKSIADRIFNLNENFEKYGEKFCEFVYCNNEWTDKVENFYNNLELPLQSKLEGYGLTFKKKDVRDSLILSSISLCVPGIVKNIKRIQNIDCASKLCYLEASKGNVPFSYCDVSSSIAYCQYTGNEILQIVPFGDFVDSFGVIGDIIEHPFTALSGWIVDTASKYIEEVRVVIEAKKLVEIFSSFGSEDNSVENIFDDNSYCTTLNEELERLENN